MSTGSLLNWPLWNLIELQLLLMLSLRLSQHALRQLSLEWTFMALVELEPELVGSYGDLFWSIVPSIEAYGSPATRPADRWSH